MTPRVIFARVSENDIDIKNADQAVKDLAAWSATTSCSDIGFVLPVSAVDELTPRAQEICLEAVRAMFQTCVPAVAMYAWGRRDAAALLSFPSRE